MAKHKHEPHEEHADESWLLPYSDMMTLLLALFIVMFAVSSVDKAQFNAMMESMYTAFGGTTDVGSPTPLPYPDAGLPSQSQLEDMLEDVTSESGAGQGESLSNLYLSLNEYVQENGLTGSVDVQYQGDKVLVTLKNDVFFEPGSAEISPEMQEKAHNLAQLLYESQDAEHPFEVIVAGHTDNVPINTPEYPSNWYLSVQRAVNFLVEMLNGSELNPTHFSSRGYGEYMPVATNDTPEGRQQNRRVELLISEDAQQALGASQDEPQVSSQASSPVAASQGASQEVSQAASEGAPQGEPQAQDASQSVSNEESH